MCMCNTHSCEAVVLSFQGKTDSEEATYHLTAACQLPSEGDPLQITFLGWQGLPPV